MHYIDTLYDICESLMKELEKANEKIRMGGGEISSGDVEYLDKLTHAVKSVKTTIAMEEASYDDGGSYDGNSYEGSSYARGRSRYARRDSMGRYSRDGGSYERGGRSGRYSRGYSRDDAKMEMMEQLEDMEKMAKDEETKRMVKQWKRQIEQG